MSKQKHLYVCFINLEDGGEFHLRKCKVVGQRHGEHEIAIVYDDDYDSKEVSYERVGDECLEKGWMARDRQQFYMRHMEERPQNDRHWHKLDARVGLTPEQALEKQRDRIEGEIQHLESEREMLERMRDEINGLLERGEMPHHIYDTYWNRIEPSALERLGDQAA